MSNLTEYDGGKIDPETCPKKRRQLLSDSASDVIGEERLCRLKKTTDELKAVQLTFQQLREWQDAHGIQTDDK